MRRAAAAAAAAVALACTVGPAQPAGAAAAAPARFDARVEQVGTSVQGRPIRALVRGRTDARVNVLVVGVIHGNEAAGVPVVRQLSRVLPPRGVRLWLVETANPDGQARRMRQNARGVDLNRNWPARWQRGGRPFDTYFPGRARASEPETRAMLRLIRRVRPDVTVWYHQHARMVIRPPLPWRQRLAAAYSRVSGLPLGTWPAPHGTAVGWQHAALPRSLGLVVELPAGRLPARQVLRHAAAVHALAGAAARDAIAP